MRFIPSKGSPGDPLSAEALSLLNLFFTSYFFEWDMMTTKINCYYKYSGKMYNDLLKYFLKLHNEVIHLLGIIYIVKL